jgi:hypothetical protein
MAATFVRVDHPEDCTGKTVVGVISSSDCLGFRFADDTYLFCRADMDVYGENPGIDAGAMPDDYEALSLGLIDDAEYERREAEAAARDVTRERAEYERLRAKFGKAEG